MKAISIIAACVVAAQAATYAPLVNGGTGKCIVTDKYDSDADTYTLTLGSCTSSDVVKMSYTKSGKPITTKDGYCLTALDGVKTAGTPVGLASCGSGPKAAQKWISQKATAQFVDGYNLCLDYDSNEGQIVQAKCQKAPMPIGSTQQYAFMTAPKPAPPKPVTVTVTSTTAPAPTVPATTVINCGQWGKSWICPSGYGLLPSMNCQYSTSTSSSVCSSICCGSNPAPPPPQYQKCGQWSVKNGGPYNACPAGTTYTAGDYDYCAANGYNCAARCCSQVQPQGQLCGQWSVKNGGPINACGTGYQYTAGQYDTCSASGSNCQQVCCSPAAPTTQSCGSWSVKNGGPVNACGTGFEYTAADGQTCSADGSDCQASCCSPSTPTTQSCGAWSVANGGPTNACNGLNFTTDPAATCNIDNSDCESLCCTA